jgi:predicted transcriptional regulator of viral defense system
MKGLSAKEVAVIADLEFQQKYYFTKKDIAHYFKNPRQIKDFIYHLKKKGRIVRVNRKKHYLIPIRAKNGAWAEHPFILADEICNGKDYFIGGWAAANYWRLTEQIPMRTDVYTTRRQGNAHLLSARFTFHRTTKNRTAKAATQKIAKRTFRIAQKKEMKEWMKSRT